MPYHTSLPVLKQPQLRRCRGYNSLLPPVDSTDPLRVMDQSRRRRGKSLKAKSPLVPFDAAATMPLLSIDGPAALSRLQRGIATRSQSTTNTIPRKPVQRLPGLRCDVNATVLEPLCREHGRAWVVQKVPRDAIHIPDSERNANPIEWCTKGRHL